MRLLAYLVITVSLVFGAIAATTAYSPRLDSLEEMLDSPPHLTLSAPAGKRELEDGTFEPIGTADDPLTRELFDELTAAGVQRVRIKEFSLARWSLSGMFALSVLGLLVGAALVRFDRRQRVAAHEREHAAEEAGSPASALAAIRQGLDRLHEELPTLAHDHQRQERITDILGELQGTHVDNFASAREPLIGRYGLAGFARIMDRFAAMERQINRAWSAAADGVLDEADECISKASALCGEVEAAMSR